jgi:hypothetical protein
MDDFLDEGDRIELSRSHELRIDGDATWVGIKISGRVREDERVEDAFDRLSTGLTEAMDQEIDKVVEYVRNKS